MAKKSRIRIPPSIEEEVLFIAEHTCCICQTRGKDVQIHHIDHNPSNNRVDNLAVLCLDCHSVVSGSRGLGKSYKPGEVRRYKRAWELHVQERRKVHRPIIRYERELISQLDLIICEILALDSRSTRVPMLFKLMYELYLWRGSEAITEKLLDGMGHLAIMAGLSDDRKAKHIPEFLWEMCWHFVGPIEVPMDNKGAARVKKCLDVMETLAEFSCEFGRGKETITKVTENTENIFEIALWYSKMAIAKKVVQIYKKSLEACRSEKSIFTHGIDTIRASSKKLHEMLSDQKPSWKALSAQLNELK